MRIGILLTLLGGLAFGSEASATCLDLFRRPRSVREQVEEAAYREFAAKMEELQELKPREVKDWLCHEMSRIRRSPYFRDIEKLAQRQWAARFRVGTNLLTCLGILASAEAEEQWDLYRTLERMDGHRDFWTEHGSNFFQGLHYQSLLGCAGLPFSFMGPRSARAMVGGVALLNLFGNAYEEIKFSESQRSNPEWMRQIPLLNIHFNTAGRPVETDWIDFASGAVASAAFYTSYRSVDALLARAFRIRCP